MFIKKRVLAGILAGAFLVGSGAFFTQTEAADNNKNNTNRTDYCNCGGYGDCYDGGRGNFRGDGRGPRHNFTGKRPEFNSEEAAERISKFAKIDKAKAKELIDKGYHHRDITMAAYLAEKSGKSVDSVLQMKKINNRWIDVAKSLNVEFNPPRDKANFSKPDRPNRPDRPFRPNKPNTPQNNYQAE